MATSIYVFTGLRLLFHALCIILLAMQETASVRPVEGVEVDLSIITLHDTASGLA